MTSNLKERNKDPPSNKGSIKKPKDFVSYLKANSQRNNGFSQSNIQILHSQLENLKETLKKKLLDHKQNMSRTQINPFEKIYDSQTNGNGDETSNLNRTLETVKNNSVNRRKDNSLKKILLISKSLPKNDESNPEKLKTLKKTEEQNANKEKTTIAKKIKFPSSTEDEFLELLNKSCHTSKLIKYSIILQYL